MQSLGEVVLRNQLAECDKRLNERSLFGDAKRKKRLSVKLAMLIGVGERAPRKNMGFIDQDE